MDDAIWMAFVLMLLPLLIIKGINCYFEEEEEKDNDWKGE